MKVSIIVPIYKVENEIERCLQSVLDQTYDKIELILVNDATPDKSFEIAKEYLANRSDFNKEIIFVEHEVNQGLSVARNSGIEASSGDYLFFLDSDDALSSTSSIRSLLDYFQLNKSIEVVIGGVKRIGDENLSVVQEDISYQLYETNSDIYTAYAGKKFTDYACGKLIKKSFLVDHQLFFKEGICFEDTLWAFFLYRKASVICNTNEIVYNYYERDGSITSVLTEKILHDFNTVILEMYQVYLSEPYRLKDTVFVIERRRRESLKNMFAFKGSTRFIETELNLLKSLKLPLTILNFKYLEQNLICKCSTSFIYRYFSRKWR